MKNKRFSPVLLKYLRSFLLVQLIPLIFFSYMVYDSRIVGLKSEIDNQYKETLTNVSTKMDYVISDVLEVSELMKTRHSISSFFYTNIEIETNKTSATIGYYQDKIEPSPEIYLYNRGRKEIGTVDGTFTYEDFEKNKLSAFDSSMIKFYSNINSMNEYLIFSDSYIENMIPSENILISCCILPEMVNQSVASIIYTFNQKQINEFFITYSTGLADGIIFFFDDNLQNVYLNYIGNPDKELDSTILEIIKKQTGIGVFEFRHQDTEYFLIKEKSPFANMNYCYFAPTSEVYKQINQEWYQFYFIVAIVCLIALVAALIGSFHNYSPIQKLLRKGDFFNDNEDELKKLESMISQQDYLKAQLEKQIPIVYNRSLEAILLSDKTELELEEAAKSAGIHFIFPYFNVVVVHFEEGYLSIDHAIEIIKVISISRYTLYPIELETEKDTIVILVNIQTNIEHQALLSALCESLQEYFIQNDAIGTVFGIGSICDNLEACSNSFFRAKTALTFLQKEEKIKYYRDINTTQIQENFPTIEYTFLSQSIRYGNLNAALEACEEMFENIQTNSSSQLIMRYLFAELMGKLLRLSVKLNVTYDTLFISKSYSEFRTFEAHKDYLIKMVEVMCQSVLEQKKTNDISIKKEIMRYIAKQYCQNEMSLSGTANHFNVSSALVSSTVNEETGMKFNQYIVFLRIEKAKEYLVQSDKLIKDIVEAIGYVDTANFIRKFKAVEGVTPGQYRENLK